ncbi:MAG: uracil phosphoribosyltransferase [Ignavibacteriales bacterium]|nr:uracil phosphoribosyltransferase [Ignavibacteriales bacterium]
MKNLTIINHPLVKRDLTVLRNKQTPNNIFRAVLRRTAALMAYEVTRDLPLKSVQISTPLEATKGSKVEKPIVLVPILRAGLGLVGGFVEVIPDANVGHIGLFRDEQSLRPVDYYFKVPKHLGTSLVLLLDPMLATGGSAVAAIDYLKQKGARMIRFVSLVAAPAGVKKISQAHPNVRMYTCALDRGLNEHGYILPGLGDAGDRMFGTE